jgi:hypothetical protein
VLVPHVQLLDGHEVTDDPMRIRARTLGPGLA